MRRALAACTLVAAGAALGGCSLGGDDEAERTRTVEVTTRVEVFADAGAGAAHGFDPQRVYEREAPGVVTVFSVFGGGGVLDREPEQEGAGSGFVLDGDGEIATNAHVVTTGEGDDLKRAKEVYVQFADGNQVDAKIVGVDPDSDIALLRSTRRAYAASAAARLVARAEGRRAGRRHRLALRRAAVAVGRRHLRPRPLDRARSPGSRSTARSRPTPRSTRQLRRPLVDGRGRVLGINSQIRSTGGGGEGVGFAVPVARSGARSRAAQGRQDPLRVPRRAEHEIYPQLAERFDLPVEQGRLGAGRTARRPGRQGGLRAGATRSPSRHGRTRRRGRHHPRATDSRSTPRRAQRPAAGLSTRPKVKVEVLRDGKKRAVARAATERPARRRADDDLPARAVRGARAPLRERVLPELGSDAGRAHAPCGAGGDVTFAIDERRGGDARGFGGRARAGASPSTPRTAAWSHRPAPSTCSSSTRSTARARRWRGWRPRARASRSPRSRDGEPTMGDVRGREWSRSRAANGSTRRAAGACRSIRAGRAQSEHATCERMFWVYGFRGRPARRSVEVIGELIDALVARRRDVRARLGDVRPDPRAHRPARRCTSSPEPRHDRRDPAASARSSSASATATSSTTRPTTWRPPRCARGGRRRRHRRAGRTLRDLPLLGSGPEYQMSILACGNAELHALVWPRWTGASSARGTASA